MATSTLSNIFSTTVTDFFVSQVAEHLSEWLKTNKSVELSAEELCEAFEVPFTPRSTMAGLPQSAAMATQMPNIPGYFSGTGASPAGKRGGRKKAPADPNAPTCVYTFQRGNKKGQTCGEVVAGNGSPGADEYCKSCLKKKTVQNRISSGSDGRSTVQPPVVPGGMVPVAEQPKASKDKGLDVLPIPGHDDMYKEVNNSFILKRYSDNSVVALAVEENGVQRPLTSDEKKTAQILGLSFVDDSPEEDDQYVPTIPSVPQGSAVPTIPTIPNHQSAPVQNIPTIPSIPQVAP